MGTTRDYRRRIKALLPPHLRTIAVGAIDLTQGELHSPKLTGCRIIFLRFLLLIVFFFWLFSWKVSGESLIWQSKSEKIKGELVFAFQMSENLRRQLDFGLKMCENLRRQLESAAKMRETLHERPI